jgi:Ca-activated chloride channel homolog
VKAFEDIPYQQLKVSAAKAPITKNVFNSLKNYVDYINETFRSVSHQQDVVRNLNSSAAYYAGLTSYVGKGGLYFTHENFTIPLSVFQKAVTESKSLPPDIASSLNDQAKVLLNVLKEMDQIGVQLEIETKDKTYEKDQAGTVYKLIKRSAQLFEIWNEKKERLYNDVRLVFDTYPVADAKASWNVSGKALYELTKLDRDNLFLAREHYVKGTNTQIKVEEIEEHIRKVISDEYENLKGIQKFGRSNGLCPYTPYEDIPDQSKYLAKNLQELKPSKEGEYGRQHPYHSIVYMYNEVADDYNKFCSLSPAPLLPIVKQPELFILQPPKKTEERATSTPTQPVQQNQVTTKAPSTEAPRERPSVQEKERIVRDTVYIERRDTIYLHDNDKNLRSMEGYAFNNLVLLLDVSGSMNAPEKLPLLKKSVLDIVSMMRPEDELAIIVFSGKPKVLLQPSSFKDENKIKKAINALKPSGTTEANAGLKLAYKVADENYLRGGNNRIILATDGQFALTDDVKETIRKFSGNDIFLSVFNFGKNSIPVKVLEEIASFGKGNYQYVSKDNVEFSLIKEVKGKRQN